MTLPTVSADDAHKKMQAGSMLLDVREDDEWAHAHIPGAMHVPLSRFMDHLQDIPKDREVLVHCAVGSRSAQVVGWLNAQGYQTANVAGGIQSWAASGLPIEP